MELSVKVTGKTLPELKTNLEQAAKDAAKWAGTGATAGKPITPKKGKAVEAEEETLEDTELEESFDAADEVTAEELEEEEVEADEEEEKPKSAKSKKLTEKEINSVCMAHAKKHGRPATLALLKKKFKVKSILELKPEQYADVVKALKV